MPLILLIFSITSSKMFVVESFVSPFILMAGASWVISGGALWQFPLLCLGVARVVLKEQYEVQEIKSNIGHMSFFNALVLRLVN